MMYRLPCSDRRGSLPSNYRAAQLLISLTAVESHWPLGSASRLELQPCAEAGLGMNAHHGKHARLAFNGRRAPV